MAQRRREDDIHRELWFHVEQAAADYIAAGMPPDEARRRARAEFGSMASTFEECREVGRSGWLDRLRQDLRYGWRVLRNDRGYAAAAIVALGLGLGANVAVFTLYDAVALQPLDVPRPAEVVSMFRDTPELLKPARATRSWRMSSRVMRSPAW